MTAASIRAASALPPKEKSAYNEIQIFMRTCRSFMSDAPQAAFVVIPEISHSDISQMIKKRRAAFFLYGFRVAFLCPFVFYDKN